MRKLSVLFCFISFLSFGQKMGALDFSITQIDSLSKRESCFPIFDYGGKIQSKIEIEDENKKTVTLGSGQESWKIQAYFVDSLSYSKLSRNEKKFYDDKNTCKLIRADYTRSLTYEDGSSEKREAYFYFNADALFYIKYQTEVIDKNKIANTTYLNFFFSDIESTLADTKPLQQFFIDKKNEILKVWLERR